MFTKFVLLNWIPDFLSSGKLAKRSSAPAKVPGMPDALTEI